MSDELARCLRQIEERNTRVEMDKAWETSWTRRGSIALITWVVAGVVMTLLGADRPWLGALVPVCGFVLSTLSLPVLKKTWVRRRKSAGV